MNRNLRSILYMIPSLSLLGLPLVAASCNKDQSKDNNLSFLEKIKSLRVNIEEIIKYEKDAFEKENATNLLDQIKSLEKEDAKKINDQKLDELLTKIKSAISEFNNRNFLGNNILKINRIVKNKTNIESDKVVEELKKAKDWNELKKVFDKYSIEFKLLEEDSIHDIKVASESHAHPHEGIIHLTIEFGNNKGKKQYELVGFKIELDKEDRNDHKKEDEHNETKPNSHMTSLKDN
ncbi:hypothetical protein [Metamycoplasma auris]|uniref:Lipoprotein n=1 Tax=Metamycoplasma auris TaxID=51363 RepID=A0A2W7G8Q7_9BACT|nr:hypothetical protein [Metamycoplasma auris]PZW01441.1 hypothetical protein BCF89_10265 [Metamycoplasma auris]